jgi:hypothetical protein
LSLNRKVTRVGCRQIISKEVSIDIDILIGYQSDVANVELTRFRIPSTDGSLYTDVSFCEDNELTLVYGDAIDCRLLGWISLEFVDKIPILTEPGRWSGIARTRVANNRAATGQPPA